MFLQGWPDGVWTDAQREPSDVAIAAGLTGTWQHFGPALLCWVTSHPQALQDGQWVCKRLPWALQGQWQGPNHFGADGASGGVDEQEDEFPVGCRQH